MQFVALGTPCGPLAVSRWPQPVVAVYGDQVWQVSWSTTAGSRVETAAF